MHTERLHVQLHTGKINDRGRYRTVLWHLPPLLTSLQQHTVPFAPVECARPGSPSSHAPPSAATTSVFLPREGRDISRNVCHPFNG